MSLISCSQILMRLIRKYFSPTSVADLIYLNHLVKHLLQSRFSLQRNQTPEGKKTTPPLTGRNLEQDPAHVEVGGDPPPESPSFNCSKQLNIKTMEPEESNCHETCKAASYQCSPVCSWFRFEISSIFWGIWKNMAASQSVNPLTGSFSEKPWWGWKANERWREAGERKRWQGESVWSISGLYCCVFSHHQRHRKQSS